MPDQHDLDRQNDRHLFTPLVLMAAIIALGVLIIALTGHSLVAAG